MFLNGFYSGKRVLVTGHTGFKGSWLSLWLSALGAKVCGVALPPDTSPALYNVLGLEGKLAKNTYVDIRDEATLGKVFAEFKPEIVFHLAAQALVRRSYLQPLLTYETNVIGTLKVLEAARNTESVTAFVNITSDKCYENREEYGYAYREGDPMGGYDMYSSSKGAAELLTASYRRSFLAGGKPFALASARVGNVIGGGDWAEDRLVPDCAKALAEGRDIMLRNPEAVRPWEHVLEPLSAYLLLGKKLYEDGGEKYAEGFNFGPLESSVATVKEVTELMIAAYGKGKIDLSCAGDNNEPHEAKLLTLNIDKAREVLGWRPSYTLQEAVRETALWYKAFYDGADSLAIYNLTLKQIKEYEGKCLWNKN